MPQVLNAKLLRAALCDTLHNPNSLLVDHFLKIKIKRICQTKRKRPKFTMAEKKGTACWYIVPDAWAKSISYNKMMQTGLMLHIPIETICPKLTYIDFQDITFSSKKKIEGLLWKTKQSNRLGRFLRQKATVPPLGSPSFIQPTKVYVLDYIRFGKMHIPLIAKKEAPLKSH